MIKGVTLIALITILLPATAFSQSMSREKFNWMLNCQGCHGAKGEAVAIDTPALIGNVARFLTVEGGREYLMSVPGVVNAPINDADKAKMLTWMLNWLDPDHIPADFKPFTEEEVATGRRNPLITKASSRRAELIEKMAK
jgi:hypothetical protein